MRAWLQQLSTTHLYQNHSLKHPFLRFPGYSVICKKPSTAKEEVTPWMHPCNNLAVQCARQHTCKSTSTLHLGQAYINRQVHAFVVWDNAPLLLLCGTDFPPSWLPKGSHSSSATPSSSPPCERWRLPFWPASVRVT
jgi:hypothetical protein